MPNSIQRTPGVYVTEEDAFPPTIIGVETAVPAFIGYTEKANISGKPIYRKPQRIGSLGEFVDVFGGAAAATFKLAAGTKNGYDIAIEDEKGTNHYYLIAPDSKARFCLYQSMKLFYENGGGACYVVSVGDYSGGKVEKGAILAGLTAIAEIIGPTMLVVPDAVRLPNSGDFENVTTTMLAQCAELQDRVAIIDVFGTNTLDQTSSDFPAAYKAVIDSFRSGVGTENLSYAAAYFPFLETTIFPLSDVDYTFFDPANDTSLADALKIQSGARYRGNATLRREADEMIGKMASTTDKSTPEGATAVAKLNGDLENALPVLREIERQIAAQLGVLPPSGAMAGVYTTVDRTSGVWNAPANIALSSVVAPTINISNEMQENLNAPLNGKAIDAIRAFPGRGTLVWGARTLDGNSPDWRYVQVRRTVIYIEQSIEASMREFAFSANDGKTWSSVIASVSNFLQQLWSQGGLFGATPSEAFSVECGLGTTMTQQDILDGYMIVQTRLQLIRPGEFIILNFKQLMSDA